MSKLQERYLEALKEDGRFVDPDAEAADLEHRISMLRDHIKSRLLQVGKEETLARVDFVLGEDIL